VLAGYAGVQLVAQVVALADGGLAVDQLAGAALFVGVQQVQVDAVAIAPGEVALDHHGGGVLAAGQGVVLAPDRTFGTLEAVPAVVHVGFGPGGRVQLAGRVQAPAGVVGDGVVGRMGHAFGRSAAQRPHGPGDGAAAGLHGFVRLGQVALVVDGGGAVVAPGGRHIGEGHTALAEPFGGGFEHAGGNAPVVAAADVAVVAHDLDGAHSGVRAVIDALEPFAVFVLGAHDGDVLRCGRERRVAVVAGGDG